MSDTNDKTERKAPDTEVPPESLDQTLVQSDLQQARSKEISSAEVFGQPQLPGYELRHRLGGGAYGEVWLAIQMNTGMRISELAGLRWTDVNFEAGMIRVADERSSRFKRLAGSARTTKGRRSRTIPIHPELRTLLVSLSRKPDGVAVPSGRPRKIA